MPAVLPHAAEPIENAVGSLVLKHGIPTAYPLTAFVLIMPIALLPWHIAHPLWLAITVLSFLLAVAAVLSAGRLLPWSHRSIVFVALSFALAPFHTGLAAGSIVCVAVAASAVGVWAAGRDREVLAGVLLAVAAGLKPQIGLPFVFYYLVLRRWRIPAVALGLVTSLAAVALIRLVVTGTSWLPNYLSDNRILFAQGSLGDFTEGNPIRFGLINFQVAAYTLLQNRQAANLAALAVTSAAGLAWLFLMWREQQPDLLELSALAVISLLPVYHRFYDAALLIFPLAWSLTALRGPLRNLARCVLLVILGVFLVPGGSALEQFQLAGHFSAARHSWWWNMFVLPHESWSVLLLSVLLLYAMQVGRRSGEASSSSVVAARHGGSLAINFLFSAS